ncbi:YqaJ viral recombinase family protein [Thiomicrorhabdus hydrogeniphila]
MSTQTTLTTQSTSITPITKNKSIRSHAQAKRMIETNNLSNEQWLQARQQGIGASDAATAVGLNPYKSQLELWMEKTGRIIPDQPSETEDSPLLWGTVLEPIVAEHYAKRTNRKVRRVNAILQHAEYPWMLANLDREIVGDDEVQVLECKTAGIFGSKLWRNGVPEYVQLQVQHQLAVTGQKAADVAVLLGGQSLQIYRIERDDDLIERLIKLEQAFWNRVLNDTPPPADTSASSETALRILYPTDNGVVLDLSHDESANQSFEALLEIREQLDKFKKLDAELKHQLQQMMGDASIARFKNGQTSWKQSSDTTAFDSKRFKTEHPELHESYLITRPGSRRFLVQTN